MKPKKSIWTSITGGLSSAAPVLLSCCKSGACVGVCASPIASLFGVSIATIANSPLVNALEPLLIAISAVSFTVSYYSLYVLPRLNCGGADGCACEPGAKDKHRIQINKAVFWFGLILSICLLTYFEYSKYRQAGMAAAECSPEGCAAPSEKLCCPDHSDTLSQTGMDTSACDTASACCASDKAGVIPTLKEMTCKLTGPELQNRKATVLAALRIQVLEKKELSNGYAFRFAGSDASMDQINAFLQSERRCCDFFTFGVKIDGDQRNLWLELTGGDGVKDFIKTELEL
jgi:hypothetical protein